MSAKVCVLASDHAEALEDRGVTPSCDYHEHVSHRQADEMIDLGICNHSRRQVERGGFREAQGLQLVGYVEGDGNFRTVHSTDGRRRITRIAQVMGYKSSPSNTVLTFSQFGSGVMVQQAIRAELH